MALFDNSGKRLNLRKGVAHASSDEKVPERFRPPSATSRFFLGSALRQGLLRVLLIGAAAVCIWVFRADLVRAAKYLAGRMSGAVPIMSGDTLFSEEVCLDVFNTERLYAGDRWTWRQSVKHEWELWLLYRRLDEHMDEAFFAASERDMIDRIRTDLQTAMPMMEAGNRIAWRDARGGVCEGRIVEIGDELTYTTDEDETLDVHVRELPVACRLRLDESFRDSWIRQFARATVLHRHGLCLCRKDFDSDEAMRAAAMEGNPEALYNRAAHALRGGEPANYAAAFRDLYCAAMLDHPPAQYRLGMLYYNGRGVDTDRERGLMWMTRSNLLGHREASQSLQALTLDMAAYKTRLRKSMELEAQERRRFALELARVENNPRYDIIQVYESPFKAGCKRVRRSYYSGRGGDGSCPSSGCGAQ